MSTSPQSAVFDDDSTALPSWKQEVNARLMAHRTRRTRGSEGQAVLPGMDQPSPRASRGTSVAARVAERYSKAPSYREVIAAEAANAARAAEAAAKAAQKAHEAAQAVNEVLWAELADSSHEAASQVQPEPPAPEPAPKPVQYRVDPGSLPEPRRHSFLETSQKPARPAANEIATNRTTSQIAATEIVDPFEEAVVAPAQPLPVRILEFPRELVAPRKARPRHAEGPLRDVAPDPERSQLRIFEVEPEAISRDAALVQAVGPQILPEWHSIRLDAEPSPRRRPAATARERQDDTEGPAKGLGRGSRPTAEPQHNARNREVEQPGPDQFDGQLYVASMEDRLMAGIVDIALVLIAFLLFVLVFVACTAHPPTGKSALMYAAIALVSIFVLYQWLFFTFAEGTPGMRYAQIALCTFDDENPTRRAMQMRIAALFLSAMPVGLGFLWALFDEDTLGWHDRISRTYQRSYR
ncbi:MAG: RDD family protein [Silvibacterium sp.]|nr:RDD family protein [Silvibacterium sp.]MBV8438083.1 RDD family protein [Silvibacterium sp.]